MTHAVRKGQVEALERLLDRGASLDGGNPTLQLGHTPRGWAFRQSARIRNSDDLVKILP